MFITENSSSKFMIMSFWAPTLKSLAKSSIPKNLWIHHCILVTIVVVNDKWYTKIAEFSVFFWTLVIC